ncbi:MAG: zinc-ribbon domain-containing protein [Methanomassiliicoccales archaeon]|nr:zinc-ribbon domain-containing protein [Methanomassiliicoccales archaeon]
MSNCASCGKAILEDMRFCPYCGQPVASEELERFEPTHGEVISAIASPAHIVGHEGIFALAFTKERLIFARIESHPGDKIKGELLQAGIFLPGSSGTSNTSRFYEMDPDQVLQESPGNFHLNTDEVDSVKLSYDEGSYVVDVRHGDERTKITLPYDKYYRDLLFQAFEGRMSW